MTTITDVKNKLPPEENSYKLAPRELFWKTEAEEELSIPQMSTEHIKNCIVWILEESTDLNCDTKDGVYVTTWMSLFKRELIRRGVATKLSVTFSDEV